MRRQDHVTLRHQYPREKVERALFYFYATKIWRQFDLRKLAEHCDLLRYSHEDCDEHCLSELVANAIRDEKIVCVRVQPKASGPRQSEAHQLARQIMEEAGSHLSFEGADYVLVVGDGVDQEREGYVAVEHAEARRDLTVRAKTAGTSPTLAVAIGKAMNHLARNWRAPGMDDALILLRKLAVRAAPRDSSEPAMTPSQLRKLAEKANLEILMVDLDQVPQEGIAFQIEAPDGNLVTGKLNKEGKGWAKSSKLGTFVVKFPDLDGADWNGDGALAIPPEEKRSEVSKHKVAQGERFATITERYKFKRWETLWDFMGNKALKEERETPNVLFPGDEISIPSKLPRIAEVEGGFAKYIIPVAAESLQMRFADIANSATDSIVKFVAKPNTGAAISGVLDSDGAMNIQLPPKTTKVVLELYLPEGGAPTVSYTMDVGFLDPLDKITGIQSRLANLGYYDGAIDGSIGPVTLGAIAQFRREYGVHLSDQANDELWNSLKWLHDDNEHVEGGMFDQIDPDASENAENLDNEEVLDDLGGEEGDESTEGEDEDEDEDGMDEDSLDWKYEADDDTEDEEAIDSEEVVV